MQWLLGILFLSWISFAQPVQGPWSEVLIDSWIDAGFHPEHDILPEGSRCLKEQVIADHGEHHPLSQYVNLSFEEHQKEVELVADARDDFSQLLQLDDLNVKSNHRQNTILYLYCRLPVLYPIPIQWLYRFGADPDIPNRVGITARDLLRGRNAEYLLE